LVTIVFESRNKNGDLRDKQTDKFIPRIRSKNSTEEKFDIKTIDDNNFQVTSDTNETLLFSTKSSGDGKYSITFQIGQIGLYSFDVLQYFEENPDVPIKVDLLPKEANVISNHTFMNHTTFNCDDLTKFVKGETKKIILESRDKRGNLRKKENDKFIPVITSKKQMKLYQIKIIT